MFEPRGGVGDEEVPGDKEGPGQSASAGSTESPFMENDMTTGGANAAPAMTVRRNRRRDWSMFLRTSSRSGAISRSPFARSAALRSWSDEEPKHPRPAPR